MQHVLRISRKIDYAIRAMIYLAGIPEGTVKSRCSRGRARLAIALAGLRNPEASRGVTTAAGAPPSSTGPRTGAPDSDDPEVTS